ncbi:MAG: hypothetical protein EAZ76_06910 [Nostocales cyanobacterium]|nr:MAG: hypothetical protein EAZ87_12255 [Nostocales cyanobacterium]TAF16714.1 MAG: hypothetical protein EAZ76_06910 [Nostocales cyanobacterium]
MVKKTALFLNSQLPVTLILLVMMMVGLGMGSLNFLGVQLSVQPVSAQIISPSDVWQVVYQQLPNFPKENQYISKDTGQVAENNTLASRLILYHIYIKGRSPVYRFDWKLTLADYLEANEIIYEASYPGNDSLRQNPLSGDRLAIRKLTRKQRNDLVDVLVNIYNPKR